jgi:hypothetical protein
MFWLTIISVFVLRDVRKVLYGARQAVHPKKGRLLGAVSVPYHEDVICLSWNPRRLQSDCKENGLEQRQIQNGGKDVKLFLFLVNLSVQVRSQCFSTKPV